MRGKKLFLSTDTSTCLHIRILERSAYYKIKYIDRAHYVSGHRHSMCFVFKTILFMWTLSNISVFFNWHLHRFFHLFCYILIFSPFFLWKGNKEGVNGKNVRFIKPSYNVIVGIGYKEYLVSSKLQREQWVVPILDVKH